MTTVRAKFRPSRALLASVKAEVRKPAARAPRRRRSRPDRLARQLALAYYIERKVEAGEVTSYGEVARRLGVTQARVSQVVSLALLPPAIQEQALLGEGALRIQHKNARGGRTGLVGGRVKGAFSRRSE